MTELPQSRSNPHRRTRDAHANETAEDYVEAVADLIAEKGECRVMDLAGHFGVSHVTVSRIVARLRSEGWLDSRPYRPIELTDKGARLARASKKRHQLVLDFLLWLGVDQETAEVDSEGIEHHVSNKTLRAMKRRMQD